MKGQKTGGRQKGTPNKRSLEVDAIAERLGIEPFEILLQFSSDTSIDAAIRVKAASEACKYLYAQKRSVEHSTGEEGFKIVIEDYVKRDRAQDPTST